MSESVLFQTVLLQGGIAAHVLDDGVKFRLVRDGVDTLSRLERHHPLH